MSAEINRAQLCARYRAQRCVTGEFFNMAQVYPFPAYRYNAGKVSYDRVLTQPYDKISPAMRVDKYYAADPHNLIAIGAGASFRVTRPPECRTKRTSTHAPPKP